MFHAAQLAAAARDVLDLEFIGGGPICRGSSSLL
jgi:hypothetical protein